MSVVRSKIPIFDDYCHLPLISCMFSARLHWEMSNLRSSLVEPVYGFSFHWIRDWSYTLFRFTSPKPTVKPSWVSDCQCKEIRRPDTSVGEFYFLARFSRRVETPLTRFESGDRISVGVHSIQDWHQVSSEEVSFLSSSLFGPTVKRSDQTKVCVCGYFLSRKLLCFTSDSFDFLKWNMPIQGQSLIPLIIINCLRSSTACSVCPTFSLIWRTDKQADVSTFSPSQSTWRRLARWLAE